MRAFIMTERQRNALKSSKLGFSEYIAQALPDAVAHQQSRSSAPLELLALSTQANTAATANTVARGPSKKINALLAGGVKAAPPAPGTLTAHTVSIPSNIAPI